MSTNAPMKNWIVFGVVAGLVFAAALFVVSASYNNAFRNGYAHCEAWYEDDDPPIKTTDQVL